jgi:hypothetical protein
MTTDRFRRDGYVRWFSAVLPVAALLLAAACGSSSSSAPSPTCSVTVGQVNTTIGAEGGSGSIPVTAGSTCTWSAASSASFISITQGANGVGTGAVQFVVAANSGPERTGTVTITSTATGASAGTTLTFTQRTLPTLAVPVLASPAGGGGVSSVRPTLVVTNAVATGNIGTVTYRFEVSEVDTFPNSLKTVAQEGIAEGSGGTTSWQVPADLLRDFLYYWRVRATNGTITTAWTTIQTFKTPR